MDDNKVPTADELAAEQAQLKIPTPEEVRTKVIEDYGFDETADSERIDRLVNREIDQAKKISSAIGAKIKQREGRIAAEGRIPKEPVTPPAGDKKEGDLTAMDVLVLSGANIHVKEDIDAVVEYARFKKITVEEALKSSIVKTTLSENAEVRKIGDATNVGTGRRAPAKVSDEALLSDSKEGKVPDDDAGIARLVEAKTKENRAK